MSDYRLTPEQAAIERAHREKVAQKVENEFLVAAMPLLAIRPATEEIRAALLARLEAVAKRLQRLRSN